MAGNKMKRVVFIRHGSVAQHRGLYPNEEDVTLTPEGEKDLRDLGPILARFSPEFVAASVVRRCTQSVEILAEFIRCPIVFDTRLKERAFPSLFGLTIASIRERHGDLVAHYLCNESEKLDLPGEETVLEAQARVVAAVRENAKKAKKTVAIVSHGGPHSWLICEMLNLQISAARLFDLGEARFSIFECDVDGKLRRVIALNNGTGILS